MSENYADPPAGEAGLFGVEWDPEKCDILIIGVPWEPTVSYGRGTSATPRAIIGPSHQLDFFDPWLGASFGRTVGMAPVDPAWVEHNAATIALVDECRAETDRALAAGYREAVNRASRNLNEALYRQTQEWLEAGKLVGVLGGDHSSPLGAMRACLQRHPGAGVLHLDAHHDLREAYEGFIWSHASIMFNLLREVPELAILVSVGIRDYSEEERRFADEHPKLRTFYDRDMQRDLMRGGTWAEQCRGIVSALPEQVYISFDVDGCRPDLCPHTGTPVPGGLDFQQAVFLLESVVDSGRKLIGFDLCEVSPNPRDPSDEWDLNVGARLLHKLCVLAGPRRP